MSRPLRRLVSRFASLVSGLRSRQPDTAGLDLLNALWGSLEIELTEPTERLAPHLRMDKAPSSAKLVSVALNVTVHVGEDDLFDRPPTPAELELVVFRCATLRLKGLGAVVEHAAPDGHQFTVCDVLAAVEETERQTRGDTSWFQGIDVHHIRFEGLAREDDGVWAIHWGS